MSSSNSTDLLVIIQQKLTACIYPLWLVFGIVGCLCNLVVFSRPQLRKTSCSIYFLAASIDHLFTLLVGIIPVIYTLNNPNPQTQTLLFCKLRGYLFQISLMLSRWFVAFACIDRYALTSDRVRLRNFAKTKTAYRIIALVIIFWSIICSHRLIFYDIKGTLCGIVNNMGAALYHSLYVIVGGGICPAAIMITCACLIRRNLAEKRRRRIRLAPGDSQRQSLDQQVLNILFIQIICYTIFTTPQLCNLVFNTISITISSESNEDLVLLTFIAFLAESILYLFPVTSFYLYTLTSRTFRKELMKFIRSIFCRNVQVRSITTIDQHNNDQPTLQIVSAQQTNRSINRNKTTI